MVVNLPLMEELESQVAVLEQTSPSEPLLPDLAHLYPDLKAFKVKEYWGEVS